MSLCIIQRLLIGEQKKRMFGFIWSNVKPNSKSQMQRYHDFLDVVWIAIK